MNSKEYFIYLLSCHLNGEKPEKADDVNWAEIFQLAENHSVTAMITQQIKELPPECRPTGKILSVFNQRLGFTVQNYELKMDSLQKLIIVLTRAEIPHLLVKGAVLRFLYPVSELRTSGDTDVVINPSDYSRAVDELKAAGFRVDYIRHNVAQLTYNDDVFEIHTELENINIQSKIYFSTPFDDISESSGYTYKLKPIYHLLYVITHIAYHLKNGGAGVRMIMDIDVLLRYYSDIDIKKFMEICDNIRIKRTAEALVALSRKWFKTPTAIDYTFEDADEALFYTNLQDIIIDGGTFGFENGGVGMVNLQRSIDKSGQAGFKTSLSAFFKWVFPGAEYLQQYYYYCHKHKILIPAAWFQRLFCALFGHFSTAVKIIKEMFNKKEMSQKYFEVLHELEIDESRHYD